MNRSTARVHPTIAEHRRQVAEWLRDVDAETLPNAWDEPASIEDAMQQERVLQLALWESGLSRHGWPTQVGGLGGPAVLRAALYEQLALAAIRVPRAMYTLETLGPALIRFAPAVADSTLERCISGEEIWCQGFSEADAGSDLASLRTRATAQGEKYVLNGHKMWSSFGHLSTRCAALVRTGESGHRGLSMLLVDLEDDEIEVRATRASGGRNEFAEIYFDGAAVPRSRLIGAEGQGWHVAMYLLQWERGMYAWQRQALLRRRMADAIRGHVDAHRHPLVSEAWLRLAALRSLAGRTVGRLSRGETPGSEISIDKVTLAATEKAVLDVVRDLNVDAFLLGDTAHDEAVRAEWFYSRAASIYGGAVDVQRTIIAERVLGLPRSTA